MNSFDTNVIIRYLTQDDPVQFSIAAREISQLNHENPGYLCTVTLAEIYWVLSHTYHFKTEQVLEVLGEIIKSDEFIIQSPLIATKALRDALDGADFADALTVLQSHQAGCSRVLTFDKKASKKLGMHLLSS